MDFLKKGCNELQCLLLLYNFYLFKLIIHLEGWLDFPSSRHVPRCIDPIPNPSFRPAVHHLIISQTINKRFFSLKHEKGKICQISRSGYYQVKNLWGSHDGSILIAEVSVLLDRLDEVNQGILVHLAILEKALLWGQHTLTWTWKKVEWIWNALKDRHRIVWTFQYSWGPFFG